MAKLLSTALAAVLGAALAASAAYGVVTSQTKAPNHNPVTKQIIDYGTTK